MYKKTLLDVAQITSVKAEGQKQSACPIISFHLSKMPIGSLINESICNRVFNKVDFLQVNLSFD